MLHLRKREDSGHRFLLEASSSKLVQLRRKIRDLGGFYIDSKYFEKSATHLVTDSIRCSEKFLGACVRGLWVLSPKYIEDSFEVGLWLDEEDYEYSLSEIGQPCDLIAAARRWRWKVSTYQEHPFTGMQVALAMESNSVFYEKLLSYGGAQIFKIPFPLHNDIQLPDISFVFMDMSYKQHVARLMEHGLVCLHYMYITDTIIKDEVLDILNYMIKDGSNISDSLDRKRYHLTGQKQTCILDISLTDQTHILEIKVDSHLSGINVTMDTESASSTDLNVKHKPQDDSGRTSDSLDFSRNKSHVKAVFNHSKSNLIKTKSEFITPLTNNVHLNKATVLQIKDSSEFIFKGNTVTKSIEQEETGTKQPNLRRLSDNKNIPKVPSTPGKKLKLCEAHNYETKVLEAKQCHLNTSLSSRTPNDIFHVKEMDIKLSVLNNTGKCNNDYEGAYQQSQHLHSVLNTTTSETIAQTNVDREKICQQNPVIRVIKTKPCRSNSQRNLKLSLGPAQHHARNARLASRLAHKLVNRARRNNFGHKNKRVSHGKSSPLLQEDVHLCDLDEQSGDPHAPTATVDCVKIESFLQPHMYGFVCKSEDIDSKNSSKYRSLWSDCDSIANISTQTQPNHINSEKSPCASLSPNIYLYGLNLPKPDSPSSNTNLSPPLKKSLYPPLKKSLYPPLKKSACETKKVTPSTISQMPKCFQTRLDKFGFSPLSKGQSVKQDLPSVEDLGTHRKQNELTKPMTQTADAHYTKRGLAKRNKTYASASEAGLKVKSDGQNQISPVLNEAVHTVIFVSDDDSDSDFTTNNPPLKSSCATALFHENMANDTEIDASRPTISSSGENVANSSLSPQRFHTTSATDKEHSKPDRSLFESIQRFYNDLNSKNTNNCLSEPLRDITQKTEKLECSLSMLPAAINVLTFSQDTKSTENRGIDLLQKDSQSDRLSLSPCSLVEDYIDLPTPPSMVASFESDVEDTEVIACTDSSNTVTVQSEVLKQLPPDSKTGPCNTNFSCPIEKTETPALCEWHLTYPILHPDASTYTDVPSLPSIYGKWMESAREMGFHDYAITHARPTGSRAPTSLLLSELVQLVWVDEVGPQAVTYLYTWLCLHPPVSSVTVSLYIEAFELCSANSVLLDIIKSVSQESKQKLAVLLLEYFVTLFEINFNFCLQSNNKSLIKNCMIVKWIWGHSHAVVSTGILHYLLRLFDDIISSTLINFKACKAAGALLSMAGECIRLAGVQWVQEDAQFNMDSIINFSLDLANKIYTYCTPCKAKPKMAVVSMFKPAWLRTLLTSRLLSHYSQYLLSDPIHINKLSLSNIVSQFFFLVPQLEPRNGPDSMGKENLEQNYNLNSTTLPLQEKHGLSKNNIQKGTLTASKVNKRNCKGESKLHIACMKDKALELERFLAVPGVDVNLRDNYGWTPLHEACIRGSFTCAELLLKYVPESPVCGQEQKLCKVEIDAVGPEGLTPLHDAIRSDRIDICKLLLRYGGQKLLHSKTHQNDAAIDLAQSDEMKEVINSFCGAASHLDLSISQEPDHSEVNFEAVRETAPQKQKYIELTEMECRLVVSRANCQEYLVLLLHLVASYYSVMGSVEKRNQSDLCLDPMDGDALANMSTYLRLFKRHLRKLTRSEDLEYFQFQIEMFETLCKSGPEKVCEMLCE